MVRNPFQDEIALAGASIEVVGGTIRNLLCPKCSGGDSSEKSFAITKRDRGLAFYCHRASCGFSGFVSVNGGMSVYPPGQGKPKPPTREYKGDMEPLPDEVASGLMNKYELSREDLTRHRVAFDPGNSRVVFPVLDPRGNRAGIVARSYSGEKPKSLMFWEDADAPKLYFALPGKDGWTDSNRVIVVEDIVSAIKVAKFRPAVALMGVWSDARSMAELAKRFRRMSVMLDPGAEESARRFLMSYSVLFSTANLIVGHPADPKDMTQTQLERYINGNR